MIAAGVGWSTLADIAAGIVAVAGIFVVRSIVTLRDRVTRLETLLDDREGFDPRR